MKAISIKLRFKKITLIELVLSLCFFSFYLPNQESVSGKVYTIWRLACLLATACAVLIYIVKCHNKISLKYISIVLFFTYIYIGTAILTPGGHFPKFTFLCVIGFITLLEVSFQTFPKKVVIRSYLKAGIAASIVYFITFIKYFNVDGGMHSGLMVKTGYGMVETHQNWYIFTYDNASVFIFLPIAAALLYYCYNYQKKATKVYIGYIVLILFMYISKMAVAAMISFVLFVALTWYYFRMYNKNKRTKLRLTYLNVLAMGLLLYIVVISFVGSDLSYTISGFFGKDGTFTGRDVIWANAIKYIVKYPVFGNGLESEAVRYAKIMMGQCHNILLEILYDGGLIGIILLGFAIYQFKPKKSNTYSAYIFSICLFCYIIAAGFDAKLGFPYPIAILYFSYYLEDKPRLLKNLI